jgi:hypothetical protein
MIDRATWASIKLRDLAVQGKLWPYKIKEEVARYSNRTAELAPIAMRALAIALDESGTTVEPSDHIPGNVRVVLVKQWRSCASSNGIEGREFDMAFAYLVNRGDVSAWGGKVWLQQNEVDQA